MPEPSDTLVWVDVETTGLDYDRDFLLEVGMVATTYNLEELGRVNVILPWSSDIQKQIELTPFVLNMHTENGLIEACKLVDRGPSAFAENTLMEWMTPYVNSVIAGHTCNFDRTWLHNYFRPVEESFHYRQFDIGSLKMMAKWGDPRFVFPEHEDAHRAIPDCLAEIEEARFIKTLLGY